MEWEGHGLCRGSPGESLRVLVLVLVGAALQGVGSASSRFGCRLPPVEVAWANPHLGDLVALVARQMFKGIAPADGFGATISCQVKKEILETPGSVGFKSRPDFTRKMGDRPVGKVEVIPF